MGREGTEQLPFPLAPDLPPALACMASQRSKWSWSEREGLLRSCPGSGDKEGVGMPSADLEDVVGTLPAEIVLAGQDDHRLGKHLQADGADQLLLQVLHSISIRNQARFIIHFASNCDCLFHLRHTQVEWRACLCRRTHSDPLCLRPLTPDFCLGLRPL